MLTEMIERADLLELARYLIENCNARPAEYRKTLMLIHEQPLNSYIVEDFRGLERLLNAPQDAPFDCMFEIASLCSAALHRPDLVARVCQAELDRALGSKDNETLRRIDACLTFSSFVAHYKPLVFTADTRVDLERIQNTARSALSETFKAQMHAVRSETNVEGVDREEVRVLLALAWVPALPETGAHLRQVASYSRSLFEAARAAGKLCKIRVLFTHDHTTRNLYRQFQSDAKGSRKIIGDHLVEQMPEADRENLTVNYENPTTRHSFDGHARNVAINVCRFDPTFAIRWYGFYQSIYIGPALHELCPVLGIQFNAGNPIDDFAHLLLAHGDKRAQALETAGASRWREHAIPLVPLEVHTPVSADALGITHDNRVFVSAIAGGRLDQAIAALSHEEAISIAELLAEDPKIKWHLIAVSDANAVSASRPEWDAFFDSGQIVCVGLVGDVRAYIQHSAGYIQLPMMKGGGMAAAMAVSEGKPVVLWEETDPGNFLSPDTILNDWPTFMRVWRECALDLEFADAYASGQRQHMESTHSLIAVGHELLGYSEEAAEIFRSDAETVDS
ncbi:MAG: hypothetical protein AAFQ22_12860 [Pseudomonadota bacterium]